MNDDGKLLDYSIIGLLVVYFAMTVWPFGVSAGSTTITVSPVCALVAAGLIIYRRVTNDRPPLSTIVLLQPPVVCCLIYFGCGLMSGLPAGDKDLFFREVLQRSIIILLPLYVFTYGPQKPREWLYILWGYLPVCSILALVALAFAIKSGFREAAYVFGIHKNGAGGSIATMGMIAFAGLVTMPVPHAKPLLLGFLGLSALGMLGCQSRAAMLSCVLGSFLILILAKAKPRYLILLAMTLVVGLYLLISSLPKETIEYATTTNKHSSNGERTVVWEIMSKRLNENPLMCVGWGNPLPLRGQSMVTDAASIFYYDWAQMSFLGLLAQFSMIISSLYLAWSNAQRIPLHSTTAMINLVGVGIICNRFLPGYLDTFWIGRGFALTTFVGVAMIVWVKLWTDQTSVRHKTVRSGQAPVNRAVARSK